MSSVVILSKWRMVEAGSREEASAITVDGERTDECALLATVFLSCIICDTPHRAGFIVAGPVFQCPQRQLSSSIVLDTLTRDINGCLMRVDAQG